MSNVWIPGNHLKIEALSCQNVTEKVNFITDVSELQDEARPKSIAPSPTAQTTGENWWKQLVKIGENWWKLAFYESLPGWYFQDHWSSIIEFCPRSWDTKLIPGHFWIFFLVHWGLNLTSLAPTSQLLRQNFLRWSWKCSAESFPTEKWAHFTQSFGL